MVKARRTWERRRRGCAAGMGLSCMAGERMGGQWPLSRRGRRRKVATIWAEPRRRKLKVSARFDGDEPRPCSARSWCPRPDLNRDARFRKPLLYPVELRGRAQVPYLWRQPRRSSTLGQRCVRFGVSARVADWFTWCCLPHPRIYETPRSSHPKRLRNKFRDLRRRNPSSPPTHVSGMPSPRLLNGYDKPRVERTPPTTNLDR